MEISVKVDYSAMEAALIQVPIELKKTIHETLEKELESVQREARSNHRFQRQTGALEESVSTLIDPSGLSGEVYLDDAIADYGQYVVSGHGTWSPDPFLDEAMHRKESEIDAAIEQAVDLALTEAGL